MLNNETVLTLSEAAARLPSFHGKRPHASSVWRWARKGIGGIRLEVLRIGGRYVTSLEALERFARELAAVDPQKRKRMPRKKDGAVRKQRVDAARSRLEKAGI